MTKVLRQMLVSLKGTVDAVYILAAALLLQPFEVRVQCVYNDVFISVNPMKCCDYTLFIIYSE